MYRTPSHKGLLLRLAGKKAELLKAEQHRSAFIASTPDITGKAIAKQDARVNIISDECAALSGFVAAHSARPKFFGLFLQIFVMWQMSSYYSGKVICVLPFEPIVPLQFFTKRTLSADVSLPTACSFSFVYFLANVGVKSVLGKLLSFGDEQSGGLKAIINTPALRQTLKVSQPNPHRPHPKPATC